MWKNKNVWIVMIGELVVDVGLWLGVIGNLEFLQRHVPSDFLKSVILFLGIFASVLISPLAGKLIDRYKKKTILIYSGLGRIISVFIMFLALYYDSIFLMIVFLICIQISAAFYLPALQSLIPMIVEENQLLTANGVYMNLATIARVLGTALAGIMLLSMSLFTLYMFSLIAYILIFLTTFLLNVNEEEQSEEETEESDDKRSSFKEVLPIIKDLPNVVVALALVLVPFSFIGGFNLVVIEISEIQNDPTIKGILYTVEGICFMAGAFIIKRFSTKQNFTQILFASAFIISIVHMTLFFADMRIPTIISFAIFGLCVGAFFPVSATLFQTEVPKKFHGRFFSFKSMVDRVIFQGALLASGLFLDIIGLQKMVFIFGITGLLLVGYLMLWRSKSTIPIPKEKSV